MLQAVKKYIFLGGCLLFGIKAFADPINLNSLPWIKSKKVDPKKLVSPFLPKNPVILEAGIHDAKDTLIFKSIWPESTIYGFEPLKDYYQKSLEKTKHLKGVYLYNLALFSESGEKSFYKSKIKPAASSLFSDNLTNITWPKFPKKVKLDHSYEDQETSVQCITLDKWAEEEEVEKIDFMWLDAEGAELFILKSGISILPRVSAIVIEINFKEFREGMTQFEDLYTFLIEQGFILKYIWGNPQWQADAIFINPNNILKD